MLLTEPTPLCGPEGGGGGEGGGEGGGGGDAGGGAGVSAAGAGGAGCNVRSGARVAWRSQARGDLGRYREM